MERSDRRGAWILLLGLLAVSAAQGQYKVVGPDGKVSYTDRPPAESSQMRAVGSPGTSAPASPPSPLPFELRQIAGRFPVVLYTSAGCQPCDAGRTLLRQRGVPHSERTIGSPADVEALIRLAGGSDVPVLTVGRQTVRGYSPGEWNGYLDAADYPKQSQLPSNYAFPAATPLVEPAATARPAPATAPQDGTPPAAPPPPAGNAPPGFRF